MQEFYWKNKTRRNIWLKPRQEGLSKIIDADQLVDCIRKPTNAVVISHEKNATTRLFQAVNFYIENLEIKPAVSIDNKSEIQFPKRNSSYYLGTAGQKAFGRGDTIQRAHLSEAAFYEDLNRILDGVSEACEYGIIDIETTANGRANDFYELYQNAKNGKSPYTAFFIPWFYSGQYTVSNMTTAEIAGLSASVQEMFAIPDDEFISTLNDEEKKFVAMVAEQWKIVLTPGQLKWRRYKIWDKGEKFWQEYPEDDVSCFLQSGRPVFKEIITDKSLQIPLDDLQNWKATDAEKEELLGQRLYAGVDGAEGTEAGDNHSFSVIHPKHPRNKKPTVIFEYTSNEPIDIFWLKILPVIRKYRIILGIEHQGVGVAHIREADKHDVGYVQWETTGTTRPFMITDLEAAYRKGELIESYPEAENQARDMEYNEKNRPEHKSGKHDDSVFSRAVALQMFNEPAPRVG